jgi:periplasmic copper chaperone A
MKTLVYILAAAALCAFGSPAHAQDYSLGDLTIDNPWAKPSLKGVPNGAAYMTITNSGEMDDTLLAATAEVSNAVELHTMSMTDGVMRMRQLEGGVPLPAGETVKLEPGGLHVMLIGLKQPLTEGQTLPLTLTFEEAGTLEVELAIEEREAGAGHSHGTDHQHGN